MNGMESPQPVRVRVDGQGRMVLPRWIRRELIAAPGEVLVRRTPDGVLLTPIASEGEVGEGIDGLPVLKLGHRVTNDDVLAAIDRERAGR